MVSSLANILENCSIEDISRLEELITEFKASRKKTNLNSSIIEQFRSEYEHYIANNFSESYLKSIQLSFKHLIKFCGQDKIITEITARDVEQFRDHLRKTAPLGYKIYITTLKAAFNKAVAWEMISFNPFTKIKLVKKQQKLPRFMKLNELMVLRKYTKSPVIADIFLFAFYTGCRPGEIINLRWGNIDLIRRLIIVGDKNLTTKNKKTRTVPICKELWNFLTSVRGNKKDNDFVFSKTNGFQFNRDYVSRCFKRAVRAAGLDEDLHLYTLRHSTATNLALNGVPLVVIKELLGHSSIVTTQIYSHADLESLQKAVGKFDTL